MILIAANTKLTSLISRIAFFIFFLFSSNYYAQYTYQDDPTYQEALKTAKELKSGILLVRLKTNENTINALNERGNYELAKQYQQKQKKENKEVIQSFSKYTFSEYYFFYSTFSNNIENMELSPFLLDSNLNKINDTIINNFKGRKIFTAEYGNLEQENFGFQALILMDQHFKYLKEPFPYYSRTFNTIFFLKRSKEDTMKAMMKKLNNIYSKAKLK